MLQAREVDPVVADLEEVERKRRLAQDRYRELQQEAKSETSDDGEADVDAVGGFTDVVGA